MEIIKNKSIKLAGQSPVSEQYTHGLTVSVSLSHIPVKLPKAKS